MIFKNPILPGFFPDPSICRVDDIYYLVTSTFAYFPGVPLFKSKDLVNWELVTHILNRPEQLDLTGCESSRGIFAPTIRYNNGVFYMITTNVTHGGNFVVTTTDPSGPWSNPYFLDAPGIDPSLFFDDNGRCYYQGTMEKSNAEYYGDNDIYLQELDLSKMKLIGERYIIWHSALKNAVWPEGPHIYKRGEYYYLLISEGGTAHEHAVTIARSKTLTDYFQGHKSNPILTHRHLGKNYPVVNVGHGDFVKTQHGDWYMVCLASRPYGGYYRNMGRETFLASVTWEDDWPVINAGFGILRDFDNFPNLNEYKIKQETIYMYLRNPLISDYIFGENNIKIKFNKNKITELDTVSYLAVRQTSKSYTVSVDLKISLDKNLQSGLVLFQNSKFNFQFLISHNNIVVLKCYDGDTIILYERKFSENEKQLCNVNLKIRSIGQNISFYFNNYEIGKSNARFLSTDVAGGFVGTTIGIYATSNGVFSEEWAVFENFKITNEE